MISGQRLLAAAEAVYKAGHQINKMMAVLLNKTTEFMDKQGLITNPNKTEDDCIQEEGDWIIGSYIENIPIYESTRKKKPSSWLGFMMTIYDEEDISIFEGWEPALYVMYGPGGFDEQFGVGSFADEIKKDEWKLHKDGRIWLSANDENSDHLDCWFFALPLITLGNEEALQKFVVEPAIKLIMINKNNYKDVDLIKIFPEDSPAFRFKKSGEKVMIVRQ